MRWNVPLMIWGESIAETSGRASYLEPVRKFDREYFLNVSAKVDVDKMVSENVDARRAAPVRAAQRGGVRACRPARPAPRRLHLLGRRAPDGVRHRHVRLEGRPRRGHLQGLQERGVPDGRPARLHEVPQARLRPGHRPRVAGRARGPDHARGGLRAGQGARRQAARRGARLLPGDHRADRARVLRGDGRAARPAPARARAPAGARRARLPARRGARDERADGRRGRGRRGDRRRPGLAGRADAAPTCTGSRRSTPPSARGSTSTASARWPRPPPPSRARCTACRSASRTSSTRSTCRRRWAATSGPASRPATTRAPSSTRAAPAARCSARP